MAEFIRKIDKKIDDEIARLTSPGEVVNPANIPDLAIIAHREMELAVYRHLKKWNKDNYGD